MKQFKVHNSQSWRWNSISDRESAELQGGRQKIDLVYICTEKGCVVWNRYDMLPPGL
jgi:hypothetical protein